MLTRFMVDRCAAVPCQGSRMIGTILDVLGAQRYVFKLQCGYEAREVNPGF